MNNSARTASEENYQPQYVTQAFKVIKGQAEQAAGDASADSSSRIANGLEPEIDLMTLVQLPARRLKETVNFYVEALGLDLTYPERPVERNVFVQTRPKIGPSLHILETPEPEFRHLHGMANARQEEFVSLYARSLSVLRESLLRAGAEIVRQPVDGYMAFLDPEGHRIGAYERADAEINARMESNITGFRHVRMVVADPFEAASFFERALGFDRAITDEGAIYIAVRGGEENQPMIRLVRAADQASPQPMHWMLDGHPKHALELHSRNIGALKERVLAYGGAVKEDLEFNGCGGYLKLYTPDGHHIWVNQDRSYCGY